MVSHQLMAFRKQEGNTNCFASHNLHPCHQDMWQQPKQKAIDAGYRSPKGKSKCYAGELFADSRMGKNSIVGKGPMSAIHLILFKPKVSLISHCNCNPLWFFCVFKILPTFFCLASESGFLYDLGKDDTLQLKECNRANTPRLKNILATEVDNLANTFLHQWNQDKQIKNWHVFLAFCTKKRRTKGFKKSSATYILKRSWGCGCHSLFKCHYGSSFHLKVRPRLILIANVWQGTYVSTDICYKVKPLSKGQQLS